MLSIPLRILVGTSILIVLTAVASNAGWTEASPFDIFRSGSTQTDSPVNTLVVTKTDDTDDGICDADCSLREAVFAANNSTGDDVITFDPSVFGSPQTILLSGGSLQPTTSSMITINGPGARLLTIKT